jgi:hypothetical protein
MPHHRAKLCAEIIKVDGMKKSSPVKLTGQPRSIWQIIGLMTALPGFASKVTLAPKRNGLPQKDFEGKKVKPPTSSHH